MRMLHKAVQTERTITWKTELEKSNRRKSTVVGKAKQLHSSKPEAVELSQSSEAATLRRSSRRLGADHVVARSSRESSVTMSPRTPVKQADQSSVLSRTSKKFDSFIHKPIAELSVSQLPGVGKTFGQILVRKGFSSVSTFLTVSLNRILAKQLRKSALLKSGIVKERNV